MLPMSYHGLAHAHRTSLAGALGKCRHGPPALPTVAALAWHPPQWHGVRFARHGVSATSLGGSRLAALLEKRPHDEGDRGDGRFFDV